MIVYTSYFGNIKRLQKGGNINFISIAGKTPEWFTGKKCSKLAPKYYWWKEWKNKNLSEEWYTEQYYNTVLNNINLSELLEELGENPILLCYETPEKFCHRHIVAAWLKSQGIQCFEI